MARFSPLNSGCWTDTIMSVKLCIPVLAAIASLGCGRSVEIVVPDTFVGEARIVFDPAGGAPLVSSGFAWTFRIPASGELRVADQSPFYRLHRETVRHESGREAVVVRQFTTGGGVKKPDGSWYGSTDLPGNTHVWVIGPRSTAGAVQQ